MKDLYITENFVLKICDQDVIIFVKQKFIMLYLLDKLKTKV